MTSSWLDLVAAGTRPVPSQLLPSLTILSWSLLPVFSFICDTSGEYKGPTSIHLEDSGTWKPTSLVFLEADSEIRNVSMNGLFAGGQWIPRKRGWEWGRGTRKVKRPKRELSSVGIWSSIQSGSPGASAEYSPEVCPWVQRAASTYALMCSLHKDCGVGWYPLHGSLGQLHQQAKWALEMEGFSIWKLEGKQ